MPENGQTTLFPNTPPQTPSKALPSLPPALKDLQPAPTIAPEIAAIRAHIAGNSKGVTRDETIAQEMLKLLHAKITDELSRRKRRKARFYYAQGDTPEAVKSRVQDLVADAREQMRSGARGQDFFEVDSQLLLDDESVAFAVSALQNMSLLDAERDVLGEAFEGLTGPSLRGSDGQFFTPRNVVKMCVEMLAPKPTERILDPACGAGGFLSEAVRELGKAKGARRASPNVVGIDKDAFLATLCVYHLSLHQRPYAIFCENSLAPPSDWSTEAQKVAALGSFDVVLTNPPFGASIPVKGQALLEQFDVARKWRRGGRDGQWARSERLMESRPPQTLFIERCMQFLRPGGRAAIVLPEGVFGNTSEGYVRSWVSDRAHVLAVVDCPLETFMPSTPTKTCVLFFQKRKGKSGRRPPKVFMAIAEHCGHDRRGRPLYREDGSRQDDFPEIARQFVAGRGSAK